MKCLQHHLENKAVSIGACATRMVRTKIKILPQRIYLEFKDFVLSLDVVHFYLESGNFRHQVDDLLSVLVSLLF